MDRATISRAPAVTSSSPVLSRKCACGGNKSTAQDGECTSCRNAKLQRRARRPGPLEAVPESVHSVVATGGSPLGRDTLGDMESRFGRSFASVRVHHDGAAASSARDVDALAYTVGEHIVFSGGQYTPGTAAGQRLLAHELAHVTQQRGAASGAPARLSSPSMESALEADADRIADASLRSGPAPFAPAAASPGTLSRQPAPAAQPAAPAAPAAQPANPCTGAANAAQVNMGRPPGARFDGALDRSACPACGLMLTMRVLFNFSNSVQPWPDQTTKNNFRDDFVRLMQDRWGHEYDFVPAASGCAGEGCQRVSVGLNVVPVGAAASPHWTLNVTYTDHFIRSGVTSGTHTGTFDSLDVTTADSNGRQVPAEHEGGHMLGFGHVNCGLNGPYTGDPNQAQCYESDSIMGAGSTVTVPEYEVFREALTTLAPGCAWRPAITDARRNRNRIAGGVTGGILGGLALGAGGAALGYAIGNRFGGAGGLVGGIIGGVIGTAGGAVAGAFAGRAIGDSSRRSGEV